MHGTAWNSIMNISLDSEDLEALLNGRVVKKKRKIASPGGGWGATSTERDVEVEIALKDIGVGEIARLLENARKS
jgi:hypothetical protein